MAQAPTIRLTGTLRGAQEAMAKLRALERSMQKRIIRKGIRRASMLGARIAKSFTPVGVSKTLRNSMGWRIARQKPGVPRAVGIIGPRRRYFRFVGGKKYVPTKYAHLVAKGTRPHRIQGRAYSNHPTSVAVRVLRRLAFKAGGRTIVVPFVNHPGARATHFLRRGNAAASGPMLHVFTRTVAGELAIQAVKARPSEVDDG